MWHDPLGSKWSERNHWFKSSHLLGSTISDNPAFSNRWLHRPLKSHQLANSKLINWIPSYMADTSWHGQRSSGRWPRTCGERQKLLVAINDQIKLKEAVVFLGKVKVGGASFRRRNLLLLTLLCPFKSHFQNEPRLYKQLLAALQNYQR